MITPPSEETMKLAKKVAEQEDTLKRATQHELDIWAEQLAKDSVAAGEAEYGQED